MSDSEWCDECGHEVGIGHRLSFDVDGEILCERCVDWTSDEQRGSAYCQCENPTVTRTLAKGTPAEKQYCECGKRVDGRERHLDGGQPIGLQRTECWRCGYDRLIYESCPKCGGSCKPLTKEKQQAEDGATDS